MQTGWCVFSQASGVGSTKTEWCMNPHRRSPRMLRPIGQTRPSRNRPVNPRPARSLALCESSHPASSPRLLRADPSRSLRLCVKKFRGSMDRALGEGVDSVPRLGKTGGEHVPVTALPFDHPLAHARGYVRVFASFAVKNGSDCEAGIFTPHSPTPRRGPAGGGVRGFLTRCTRVRCG